MCLSVPRPPKVKPPAPPPPTPPPPPAPKPLPDAKTLEQDTKPNVSYGRKKSDSTRARAGGTADQLRVPLNTPTGGGGLNA